jgi:CMP-N-acetylneuraminic acid synthetase
MKSGKLSQFYSTWGDGFYGGKYVKNLKKIAKNSCVEVLLNFKSIDIDNKEDLELAKKIHSLNKK